MSPKFKQDEEEAVFWDWFDTAQILEEGEEIELECKPEAVAESICIQCGENMIERKRDVDAPGEEVTSPMRRKELRYGAWIKE